MTIAASKLTTQPPNRPAAARWWRNPDPKPSVRLLWPDEDAFARVITISDLDTGQTQTIRTQPDPTLDGNPRIRLERPASAAASSPVELHTSTRPTVGGPWIPQPISRTVFVPGTPRPQGSKAYKGHRAGKPVLVESSTDLQAWRTLIARTAHYHARGLLEAPLFARLDFVMPRPKHLRGKPTPPATARPDLDKLARAVFDALTDTWTRDDAHIVTLHTSKRIAEPHETPGVLIHLHELDPKDHK